ncbi:MAG: hypothetical protein CMN30_19905 [Sandaracinus sp.]|nr:hypothetical protein [Sandaracinus sp.]
MVGSSSDLKRALGGLFLFATSACSVGVGEGEVTGTASVPACDLDGAFDLDVGFYAADPWEDQLTIRLQRGGDYAIDTDGVAITILDATTESMRLGTPIALSPGDASPVTMTLYLNYTCPAMRDDLPVFLEAVEGTLTFDALYAPEVDDTDREIRGHFEDVRFTDTDPPADGQTREVILSGEFSFLFERGRPAQPFP